jgi:hypothetical protein
MKRQVHVKSQGAHEVIAELARQTERPIEEVARVYQRQLEQLEAYATVPTFVPVFAKRLAREVLTRH